MDVFKTLSGEVLDENDIRQLKRVVKRCSPTDRSLIKRSCRKEYYLTEPHTQKGLNFLLNAMRTPKGIVRKTNPFNTRQQNILNNFSYFTFVGFKYSDDVYKYYGERRTDYLPIYKVYDFDGNSFCLYYDFKNVHIVPQRNLSFIN